MLKVAIGTGSGGGTALRSLAETCATPIDVDCLLPATKPTTSTRREVSRSSALLRTTLVDLPFRFARTPTPARRGLRRTTLRVLPLPAFPRRFLAFALIATWDNTLPFLACLCQGSWTITRSMSYSQELPPLPLIPFITSQFRNPADESPLTPALSWGRVPAPRFLRRIQRKGLTGEHLNGAHFPRW